MQGYRTIFFNLIMAATAIARSLYPEIVPPDEEITKFFDAIWAVVIIGGNIWLRIFITKGPVGITDPKCK
jgi:hypothetical protein